MLITLWGFLLLYNYCVPLLPIFKIFGITINMPQLPALALLIGFIFAYTALINIAYKQKRIFSKKQQLPENTDYQPFVSVVVPCHCEANVIGDTIKNLINIDYPHYELLIIDDRSTDDTAIVLKKYEDIYNGKMRAIIRAKDALAGKSAVLNEVFDLTQGEVICVFDADARVKPDFLTKILPYLAPKDVGAVQARKIISNRDYNFLTRCQDNEMALDSHFQCGRDSIKGAVELRGNGQLIKKESILIVDKWNNDTITDDLDLSTKLHLKGWDVRFCLDVEVYEEGVLTFPALIKQRSEVMRELLKRKNVQLHDFQSDVKYVENHDYFCDVQHFSNIAAKEILKDILSCRRKITTEAEIAANEKELRSVLAKNMPEYKKKYEKGQR